MAEEVKDNEITVGDCIKGAFEALLRGDTDERDRLCELARMGFDDAHTPVPDDTPIRQSKGTRQ